MYNVQYLNKTGFQDFFPFVVRKQTNALIIILTLILGILARKHFEIQVITKISEKETMMF